MEHASLYYSKITVYTKARLIYLIKEANKNLKHKMPTQAVHAEVAHNLYGLKQLLETIEIIIKQVIYKLDFTSNTN